VSALLPAAAWDRMPSLKVLDASFNQLGSGLQVLFPETLQQLYLDHNNLTGTFPSDFAAVPNLRCWSLDHNPGLCGLPPPGALCFDAVGTSIGERLCNGMLHPVPACAVWSWEGSCCGESAPFVCTRPRPW
jgi:hypothetical protein